MTILLLLLGLAMLTAGADVLVRAASALALKLGLSGLVVGLTVVSFGTSAPELMVSVTSALEGQGAVAMGNVVGSNIFNIAVVLGLSALICPLSVHVQLLRWDMPVLVASSGLFAYFLYQGGELGRGEGAVLWLGLIAYTAWTVVLGKRDATAVSEATLRPPTAPGGAAIHMVLVGVGLALMVGGARLFVDHAVLMAERWGVDQAVIGLTLIAAGTSLPELATSVMAAIRRQTDLAVGNIVGSGIFNVLCIAGSAGMVRPVTAGGVDGTDLTWMLGLTVLLLPLMKTGFKLVRWEGIALLAAYAAYLWGIWPSA